MQYRGGLERAKTMEEIFGEGEWLTAEVINSRQRNPPSLFFAFAKHD